MKKIVFAFLIIGLLMGCTKYEDGEPVNKSETEEKDTTEQKVEAKEDKFETKKIKLDNELAFQDFKIEMGKVKVYEKEDKKYANIELDWTNLGGEKLSLQAFTKMDVLQDENSLAEIDDSWNPENAKVMGNDAFFKIENGVTLTVNFEYELIDGETPIDVVFYPLDEDEETIKIDIN